MLFNSMLLASLAAGSAFSLDVFDQPQSKAFRKRQEFSPNTVTCGPGNTCAESCGTGYILCSDPTTFLCYNPDAGQSCCEGGSPSSWACPSGNFCLVDDFCCPNGEDANSCAASNSVTLPATFIASTATPAAGGAATSSSYVAASTTSATTTPVATQAAATPTSSFSTESFTESATTTFSSSTPPVSSIPISSFAAAANADSAMGSTGLLYGLLVLIGNLI